MSLLYLHTWQWPSWPLVIRRAQLRTGCANACAQPHASFGVNNGGPMPSCTTPSPALPSSKETIADEGGKKGKSTHVEPTACVNVSNVTLSSRQEKNEKACTCCKAVCIKDPVPHHQVAN
eukprot:1150012-Pelagomonas_calceolata.AAC.2